MEVKRVHIRMDDKLLTNIDYWSEKNNMNRNEYLLHCIDSQIRRENRDYDLPTLEIARLNQLVEIISVLSNNVKALENITISGFDSLLNLTRGDNYLLEDDGVMSNE